MIIEIRNGNIFVCFQYEIRVLPESVAKYMPLMPAKKQIDLASVLISPMPGIVKSVSVKVGQRVAEGQEVCVVEAMKMQNKLTAGRIGVVCVFLNNSILYSHFFLSF